MADCLFCEIAAGRTGAFIVREDEHTVAFLDRRPLFPGHCLVIPRQHHVTLPELPVELAGPLFEAVRELSAAVPRAMSADGSFVAVNNTVSQSVAHLHVHVVPRKFKDGLRGFFWPRQTYRDDAEAREIQDAISKSLRASAH